MGDTSRMGSDTQCGNICYLAGHIEQSQLDIRNTGLDLNDRTEELKMVHEILPYPRIYILTSNQNMRRMEEGSGLQVFFMGRRKRKEE